MCGKGCGKSRNRTRRTLIKRLKKAHWNFTISGKAENFISSHVSGKLHALHCLCSQVCYSPLGNERVPLLERSFSGSKYKSNSVHTSQTCCCFPQKSISNSHSVCKMGSSNALKMTAEMWSLYCLYLLVLKGSKASQWNFICILYECFQCKTLTNSYISLHHRPRPQLFDV